MSELRQINSNCNRLTQSAPSNDFPFYNGVPQEVSGRRWFFVMGMVILGFLVLTIPVPLFAGRLGQYIPVILFLAIPLLGLAIAVPKHWKAIFRKVKGRDVLWMGGFALLNIIVSMGIATIMSKGFGTHTNAAIAGLTDLTTLELVLFFLKTIPQLIGEEVLTILPFLALMNLLYTRREHSRKSSIVWAWLISAVIFGLAHLPTYGWDVMQCVIVIGSARLVLMLPYLLTKNIWVSTGTHILNDWIIFSIAILGATTGSQ